MNDDLHRILIKGGVTSPGELKDSISMLEAIGLEQVYFGSRQDLLFPLGAKDTPSADKLSEFKADIIDERSYQNIVCSYVCADIFEMTYWLKGSTYLYLLERFDYQPKIKINIVDPKQRLVPLFSGNLNFIASEQEDYWYLHLDLPSQQIKGFYPVLVYSWDIVKVAKTIENVFEKTNDIDGLFEMLNSLIDSNNKTIDKKLEVPYLTFPYYEGMNRMGLDRYWLGLYWRNNRYNLAFLKELCGFCLENSIGKICITPWKSLIIKGIKQKSRSELERFLGTWGINIRHSQLEINWHLPVDDSEALELKNYLVRCFDQNDISTYGLTFGISNDVGKRSHFASVIIERNQTTLAVQGFKVRATYNVLHFENFDPNTQTYLAYANEVDKTELPGLLMELSKKYFEQLGTPPQPEKKAIEKEIPQTEVHQCQSCLTVYDEAIGDPDQGILSGTPFDKLPKNYKCPVCEASLSNFLPVKLQLS